jgi:Transglutaminase-like superfamily
MTPPHPDPVNPPPAPRPGAIARLGRDLGKAWHAGPRGWADLVRALAELALARLRLRFAASARLGLLDGDENAPGDALSPAEAALVERVAKAVSAMGNRAPWRSDCLVQALAARRWLASAGVATRLAIGARHDAAGAFQAHAWLSAGERLVTGGDVSAYREFLRPRADPPS